MTKDLREYIGRRVEIPVHYDLWMRGARVGVVRSTHKGKSGQSDYLKVKMDNPHVKKLLKIWRLDVPYMKVIGEPVLKNPSRKRRGAAKRKAHKLAVRSVVTPKKRMRKRRKITHVRKNPLPKFAIVAHVGKKKFYLRQSTGSFIASKADATHFKSKVLAVRTARAILKQLPSKIASLGIERI